MTVAAAQHPRLCETLVLRSLAAAARKSSVHLQHDCLGAPRTSRLALGQLRARGGQARGALAQLGALLALRLALVAQLGAQLHLHVADDAHLRTDTCLGARSSLLCCMGFILAACLGGTLR